MQGLVAGVDLGGTKVLAGLCDRRGTVLAVTEEPTEHGEQAPVLAQIPRMILSLVQRFREYGPLHTAVIGVPTAVSPLTGLSSLSPNLAIPADQPLAGLLGRNLPCPVFVENDVNLAAFAEVDADPNQHQIVMERGGRLVGTFQLTVIPGISQRGLKRALIESVRVDSSERGSGLGTRMMQWAVEESRRLGCGLVQLTSNAERSDAHRFYRRLGFEQSHVGFKLKLERLED